MAATRGKARTKRKLPGDVVTPWGQHTLLGYRFQVRSQYEYIVIDVVHVTTGWKSMGSRKCDSMDDHTVVAQTILGHLLRPDRYGKPTATGVRADAAAAWEGLCIDQGWTYPEPGAA